MPVNLSCQNSCLVGEKHRADCRSSSTIHYDQGITLPNSRSVLELNEQKLRKLVRQSHQRDIPSLTVETLTVETRDYEEKRREAGGRKNWPKRNPIGLKWSSTRRKDPSENRSRFPKSLPTSAVVEICRGRKTQNQIMTTL